MADRLRTWFLCGAMFWGGAAIHAFWLGYEESAAICAFFSAGALALVGVMSWAVRNG